MVLSFACMPLIVVASAFLIAFFPFFSVYDCYYKTFGKEKNGGGSILYYIIMPLYIDLIDLIDNQFFQGLEGRSLTCLQARLQAV